MELNGLTQAYSQFGRSDLGTAIGIQLLSKVKEQAQVQGQQMVEMLQSAQPHLGRNVDILV